ncbi:MAG: DnaB-like helicase C-terminal domain-containing protein, partial [Gammaproteobacteria bacterium]
MPVDSPPSPDSREQGNIAALKVPPHSVDAEQAVLGGLMQDDDKWHLVADLLLPNDFYRAEHRLIYQVMLQQSESNGPIDVVTLAESLNSLNELDNAGGSDYLSELAANAPGTANIESYATIIRDRAILRRLISVANNIADTGYNTGGRPAADVLDDAEQAVFNINNERERGQGPVHVTALVRDAVDRIDELAGLDGNLTGISSGYADLDNMTAGWQRSDLIIVAGRPSMGKCLSHDSEIVREDGSVTTIEELYRHRNSKVATLQDDLTIDWTQPSNYIDDGHKPVFEVSTRLGRRVETTLTHPFLTLGGWKRLAEIEEGDYIAVPRKLAVFGSERMRDCEVKLLAYMIGDGGLTTTTPRFTSSCEAIQQDFTAAVNDFGGVRVSQAKSSERTPSFSVISGGEAIADARNEFAERLDRIVAASGNTARAIAAEVGVAASSLSYWRRGISVPDTETANRLADVLSIDTAELGSETVELARRNRPNPLRAWLTNLKLYGQGAHGKHIPDPIFQLPREQIALFLNRLFATDGWASALSSGQSQIGYSSVSEQLARQVQHLLLRFGILVKLRLRWVLYNDARRPSWQLDVTHHESIRRFVDEIGIFAKEAAVERVKNALGKKRQQSNTDIIPVEVWQLLEQAKGEMTWAELARRAGVNSSNVHAHRRAMSRQHLAKFALVLQSPKLMQLANSDVYWDRVESITALGNKQVYDLTIPDTHNFIANDVCVHNTAFAMNLVEHAILGGDDAVVVFSLEMPAESLIFRLMSSIGRIDQSKVRTGNLSEDDWPGLNNAVAKLKDRPLYIDDTAGITPMEMRARLRRIEQQFEKEGKRLGMVVVDYLQLMQLKTTTENRVGEIS